jgi:hypothetical protein
VLVWIGTTDGPAFHRQGRDYQRRRGAEENPRRFPEKYWQNRVLGIGPSRAKFDHGNRVAIVITPTRDLAGGFTSAPGTPPPLEMPATGPGIAP